MRLAQTISQSPGAVSSAKNGSTVNAIVAGQVAVTLSCAITFTGSSESGATAQLFKSNDGTNWAAEGSTVSISGASGIVWLEKTLNSAPFWRIQYADASGSYTPTELWKIFV
jgi:hypothetical protein